MANDTSDTSKPWYQSIKVVVFLLVFLIITCGLIILVGIGKLPCDVELVGAYITGVVALAAALFVGRGVGSVGRGLSAAAAALAALLVYEDEPEDPPDPEEG